MKGVSDTYLSQQELQQLLELLRPTTEVDEQGIAYSLAATELQSNPDYRLDAWKTRLQQMVAGEVTASAEQIRQAQLDLEVLQRIEQQDWQQRLFYRLR